MDNGGSGRRGSIIDLHPCFSEKAHHRFGRIHLPVAPACNVQCNYCIRKFDCANESRPGVSSTVLRPTEAVERVRSLVGRNERLSVVGIAGPGDPLANPSTFETLQGINREFPELILCVSTNGLLLPDRLEDLVRCGVQSVTVTINAITAAVAASVYAWIVYRGKRLEGTEAGRVIVANQWKGLMNALEAGILVKVNTVYIPGVNDDQLPLIAGEAGGAGADIMNIIPLIPQAAFAKLKRPTREMLHAKRVSCASDMKQMTHCRQCRADACGTLGQDLDMELEVLNARIGEEYCETV